MDFQDIAIGTDIEQIERFQKYQDKEDSFVRRVFSEKEIEYCYANKNFAQHLAVRYCAKEAIIKALTSFGMNGFSYCDFEILNKDSKEPYVNILKESSTKFDIKVSLSHSKDNAVAMVIVQRLS